MKAHLVSNDREMEVVEARRDIIDNQDSECDWRELDLAFLLPGSSEI